MPPQANTGLPNGEVPSVEKSFSAAEVAQHNVKGDTYLIVDNKVQKRMRHQSPTVVTAPLRLFLVQVYDVSEWMGRHPGGHAVIKQWGGMDATSAFNAFHQSMGEKPRQILRGLLKGKVEPP